MISTEKPGSPEELVHFGAKGMKWGVRKSESSSGQSKTPTSTKKKVAIGVGVTALVAGTAFVSYKLGRTGHLPLPKLDDFQHNKSLTLAGKRFVSKLDAKQMKISVENVKKLT